jgi:hypothetical protein
VSEYALPKPEVIVIGRERAEQLFAYPINIQTPELLEQTVAWWLSESLRRDNISDITLTIGHQGDDIAVSLAGLSAARYAKRIKQFLDVGDKAYAGVRKLKEAGVWQKEWRFLLPLGLPILNHRSVQLLHFPPIAVLIAYADYLKVPTTVRWSEMLARNGARDTDIYQAIADIAPAAMPQKGGGQFDSIPHIYDVTFKDYIDASLEFWAGDGTRTRHMVAFGGAVRNYVSDRYLGGRNFPVLGYEIIKLDSGVEIPTLAANHPSDFYVAITSDARFLKTSQDWDDPAKVKKAVCRGMEITRQDLIAACWQVLMAEGDADGEATLAYCKERWGDRRNREICQIVIEQGGWPPIFRGNALAADLCSVDFDICEGFVTS